MHYGPIRATVSPETITKVTRLFNGSLSDIINELFQNARRAGATKIEVITHQDGDNLCVTITDNGSGIADPACVLALGTSGWDGETIRNEDAAGMGVFSLAGKEATIISRCQSEDSAWRARISPSAWTGGEDIAVEACDHPVGTTISFTTKGPHEGTADHAVTEAAKHFPVDVIYNGTGKPRHDFLHGALQTLDWHGNRIGIFKGDARHIDPTINFHGVTIHKDLFTVKDTHGRCLHVRLDIESTNGLQLVLPARKEVVQNEALQKLVEASERAIFSYIATQTGHDLSFEQWSRAKELGIELPEANPCLDMWEPDTADSDNGRLCNELTTVDGDEVICAPFEAHFDQAIARALEGTPIRTKLVFAKPAYEGYSWYEALPQLTKARFTATIDGQTHDIDETRCLPAIENHAEASAVKLHYTLSTDGGLEITTDTDVVTIFPDGCCYDGLNEIIIIHSKSDKLDPETLVDFLDNSCFSAWTDSDADSWDTQHDRFLRDARELAHLLLEGENAAIASQFRDAVARIAWTLPAGKTVSITLAHGQNINVRVKEADNVD